MVGVRGIRSRRFEELISRLFALLLHYFILKAHNEIERELKDKEEFDKNVMTDLQTWVTSTLLISLYKKQDTKIITLDNDFTTINNIIKKKGESFINDFELDEQSKGFVLKIFKNLVFQREITKDVNTLKTFCRDLYAERHPEERLRRAA